MNLDFSNPEIEDILPRFKYKCLVFGLMQQLGEFDRSDSITYANFYHLEQELKIALERLNEIKDEHNLDY